MSAKPALISRRLAQLIKDEITLAVRLLLLPILTRGNFVLDQSGICLRFCSRPVRMRNWLLLPVKSKNFTTNVGS